MKLQLISTDYLSEYLEMVRELAWNEQKLEPQKPEITQADFEYYWIASSLYSSKIEGNTLDVNSFFAGRGKSAHPKQRELTEIEDLVLAYRFASEKPLTEMDFLACHGILSRQILPKNERGKYRTVQVGIRDSASMRRVYLAVEPENVQQEMTNLFSDIKIMTNRELSLKETFYFASMIHLWLAKIHPFTDGNGRAARLLEKWFLAQKLGFDAWLIASEKYYWDNREDYYKNISLGFNYYALFWERCLPFLEMLPQSLKSI